MRRTPAGSNLGRREEILRHATDIIEESGLAGLTMKKVAARVGFTEAAAYRYFCSKQALLEAIVDEIRDALLSKVRELALADVGPATRVERILRFHVGFVTKRRGLPVLLMFEAAATGDQVLLGRLRAIVDQYLSLLSGVLAEMTVSDGAVSVRDLAMMLLGIPSGVAMRLRLEPNAAPDDSVSDQLIPFVVRALENSL